MSRISCSFYHFYRKGGRSMARSARLESGFQDRLISTLKARFPGCMIFKMDQRQGIPDLLILYGEKWASLECKRSNKAKRQPNQEYYVGKMNEMSFSRFISPENKEEVLESIPTLRVNMLFLARAPITGSTTRKRRWPTPTPSIVRPSAAQSFTLLPPSASSWVSGYPSRKRH